MTGEPLHTREYITLRDYVDRRLEDHDKVHRVLDANVERTDKALTEKQATANEFRGALEDQARSFVTRSEFAAVQRVAYLAVGMAILAAVMIPIALKFVG